MSESKRELRTRMRRLLREVRPETVVADSLGFAATLVEMSEWSARKRVLLYGPLPGEINPAAVARVGDGRRYFAPRVVSLDPPTMEAVEACTPSPPLENDDDEPRRGWRRGRFGNWEPTGDAVPADKLTLALVPGLAFTRDGGRLGRGKGFYDRFLEPIRDKCFLVGAGHDFQLVDDLPAEPHDVVMDAVVTPSKVWRRPT